MTKVLIVEWLGRGGIAQTTESWVLELRRMGAEVRVVTRPGRELGPELTTTVGPPDHRSALVSHACLCRAAVREIRSWRPDVVVVQNYVIPLLEAQVHEAARKVGASVVFVIHDHRHHEWREGTHLRLDTLIDRADEVVAHTRTVAAGLDVRGVRILPLPVLLGLSDATGAPAIARPASGLLALQFGVLNRAYKGTDITVGLAEAGVTGWSFALAGVGAPACAAAQRVDRFLEPGELLATVALADAVLLPYREATQSGAVVVAQLCGTVVVASAVGGVGEQIDDGRTGLLVPPGAGTAEWRARLEELSDEPHRLHIAGTARRAIWAQHEEFRSGIAALTGASLTGACT